MPKASSKITRWTTGTLKRLVVYISILSLYIVLGHLTYAMASNDEPDIVITIGASGSVTYSGSLLGNDLWYPGKQQLGVIRIVSERDNCQLNNFTLLVDLKKFNDNYNYARVLDSFLNNMYLTVEVDRMLISDKSIVASESFKALSAKDNCFSDLSLDKGESLDLKYTLEMDQAAGEELENLTANINFRINAQQ